jgi:hypothetical protein
VEDYRGFDISKGLIGLGLNHAQTMLVPTIIKVHVVSSCICQQHGGEFVPLGNITEILFDKTFGINVKGLLFKKRFRYFKTVVRSF